MCDYCDAQHTEVHECARCAATFCLDCGYLRYNETGESDWICYQCDVEKPSFAVGACPNCGHDWTAHSAYIDRQERICVEVSPDGSLLHFHYTDQNRRKSIMSDTEKTAEALYHFITGYRYHGPMVHDLVKPEAARKQLMQLVEKYQISFADIQVLLTPEHFGSADWTYTPRLDGTDE
jgi:hypothetical protein